MSHCTPGDRWAALTAQGLADTGGSHVRMVLIMSHCQSPSFLLLAEIKFILSQI
jgi:hypothetical protein